VPWMLDSSKQLYHRSNRPLPGQDRRGEPRRPVMRKPLPPAAPRSRQTIASNQGRSESPVDRAARAIPSGTTTAVRPTPPTSGNAKTTTTEKIPPVN